MNVPDPGQDDTTSPTVSRWHGCVILTVRGDLDHSAAGGLRELLFDPTVCDQPTVVVDLRGVTHLGSTAVGGLVAARRWHQARETTLTLIVKRASTTADRLSVAPLSSIFDVRDSIWHEPTSPASRPTLSELPACPG